MAIALKQPTQRAKQNLREIIVLALFAALMLISKEVLAALPNIEIVTLLIILLAHNKGEIQIPLIMINCAATRMSPDLARGASPRATLGVMSMAKAHAYLSDRDYVVPADVRAVFSTTVFHRLILTPDAEHAGKNAFDIANEILTATPAPNVLDRDRTVPRRTSAVSGESSAAKSHPGGSRS